MDAADRLLVMNVLKFSLMVDEMADEDDDDDEYERALTLLVLAATDARDVLAKMCGLPVEDEELIAAIRAEEGDLPDLEAVYDEMMAEEDDEEDEEE